MARSTAVLALALLLAPAAAFLPSVRSTSRVLSHSSARYAATVEKTSSAGAVPDETFPGVAECPFTQWGPRDIAISERESALGEFAPEIFKKDVMAEDASVEEELEYFRSLRSTITDRMRDEGAIILRGFELTKTSDGFLKFYLALGLKPCDDPLQSVAARDTVDKDKGVYEAVNKESRAKYFVGMHNEQVGTRSPARAAFVCFKAAEEGGEFLILDGRKLLRELDGDFLQELYDKQVRFIAAELPLGFIESVHPAVRRVMKPALLQMASVAAKKKVDFDIDLIWSEDNEGKECIHVIAPPQPPIVRHPENGLPVWFCNIHSHSDVLRQQREERDGTLELSETTGASRLNRTDIRFGDFSKIPRARLEQVDEAVMKNLKWVKMAQGDVVLLDNYNTMHGRNIFEGTRKHAVTWFK